MPPLPLTDQELRLVLDPFGAVDHPEDECFCGCPRRDHENGVGACRWFTHHIPDPELNECKQFRLTGRVGWRDRMRAAEAATT